MRVTIPKHIGFSLMLAVTIWSVWLLSLGQERAIEVIAANWQITVTMAFGSVVGGGTSEGGGSIAFPVLTKILHVMPMDAKMFALAIQSVGMTAASLVIIVMRLRVEWRAILWAMLGGIPGICIGTALVAPLVPASITRMIFTVMVASFALTLFALNRSENYRNDGIFPFGPREQRLLVAVGLLGGLLTGLVGTGIDIVVFSLLVLLFRINEKIATPTTVILQSITVIFGFALHYFVIGGFTDTVRDYWLAAIPVVVVGAPLGAMVCAKLPRPAIVQIVLVLIMIEVVSSLHIVPLTPSVIVTSLASLAVFSLMYYRMYASKKYVVDKSNRPEADHRGVLIPLSLLRQAGMDLEVELSVENGSIVISKRATLTQPSESYS